MDNLLFDTENSDELSAATQYMAKISEIEKSKLASTKEALYKMHERNEKLNVGHKVLISKLCDYHTRGVEDNLNCIKLTQKPIFEIIDEKLKNLEINELTNNSSNHQMELQLDNKISVWKKNYEKTEIFDFHKISLMIDYLKNILKESSDKMQNYQNIFDDEKAIFKQEMDKVQDSINQLNNFEKDQKKILKQLNETLQTKTKEIESRTKDMDKQMQTKENRITDLERELLKYQIFNLDNGKQI